MEIILLTKNNCPQCEKLKKMLNMNPKTKGILDKIKTVHELENPEEYEKLTDEYGILSMPALIIDGKLIAQNQIPQALMKASI